MKSAYSDIEGRSQIREFSGNTTLHGVRYLAEKSIFRRFIWFVALGAAFGFCGLQIYKTLSAFYGRPFSTSLTRERQANFDFPAVTLCNMNLISKKQYTIAQRFDPAYANTSDAELREEIQMYLSILSSRGSMTEDETLKEYYKIINASEIIHQRGPMMRNMLQYYSHAIDGMLSLTPLRPCRWGGKPCSGKNFTSLLNLRMGQCFTFNSGKQGHPLLKSTLAGPTNGLRLMLNVEEEDHVSNFYSLPSGFKILIHNQNEYPLIEEFGFAVQPGTHTYVAVRKNKFVNLETPYKTECAMPELEFTKYFGYSYSVHACIKQCMHDYVTKKCHCQPLFNITAGVELCSIKDVFECILPTVYGNVPEEVSSCSNHCPEPCKYTKYETKLSYATAISNAFTKSVPSGFVTGADKDSDFVKAFTLMSEDERQKYFRNNVVSLDIYFEELSYDVIEQKAVFDSWALLGAIGGFLGLFLGMSVLTVLEFLDFIVVSLFKALRGNRVKDSTASLKENEREGHVNSLALDMRVA